MKFNILFCLIWFVQHLSYESIYLTIYSEVMVARWNISIFRLCRHPLFLLLLPDMCAR